MDAPLPPSQSLTDRFALVLATGGGIGFIPVAPGTFGSLWGVPLAWGLEQLPVATRVACAVALVLIGIPICARGARVLGRADPGPVVWDEITAFPLVFCAVRINAWTGILGFLLFRIFDMTKPWPCRQLERLPGGLGIMADDLAAGAYAAIILALVAWGWPVG